MLINYRGKRARLHSPLVLFVLSVDDFATAAAAAAAAAAARRRRRCCAAPPLCEFKNGERRASETSPAKQTETQYMPTTEFV
jgi:hypothetical protein